MAENADDASEPEVIENENTFVTETPVDLYAPVFLAFTSNPQTELGEEFDIHKFVGYADDADRDVTLENYSNLVSVGKYSFMSLYKPRS